MTATYSLIVAFAVKTANHFVLAYATFCALGCGG